jgi:parallel beta-helix repeat protein
MKTLGLPLIFILVTIVCLPFMAQPSMASSTIYIRADGSIDPPSAPISTTNNIIYTLTNNIYDEIVVEKNDIVINGASYTVQGSGTGNGFTLYSVTNVALTNINIKNFAYGVYLESSSYNSIHRNNISGNDYDGIEVYFSSDCNNIADNRIEANGWFGVGILYSNNNTISGNNIANNDDGLDLYDASGTEISKNRITGSGEFGIGFYSSSDNAIFQNDFVNNTQHIYSESSTNRWDNGYPSGGNYWSGYAGVDLFNGPNQNLPGSDGIADSPYSCSEDDQDRYPLMQTFTNVAVQGVIPIKTVVGQGYNATIAIQVENQGWETRTTNVEVTLDTTTILTLNDLVMTGKNRTILTYTWQTSGYSIGNYTLSATATTVPGETDTTDNNCTWMVHVGVPGDVSSSTQGLYDGIVNMRDIQYMILLFNAKPGSTKWNPNADVNNDLVVNMRDINIAIMNFNKHE